MSQFLHLDASSATISTDAANPLYVRLSDGSSAYDGATETTLAAASAKLPASLGSKLSAASLSVVLASDGTLPLPSGAATSAKQDTGNTSLAAIDTKLGGTIAVSAASLPLPTGAATAAKQPALGTAGTASADVITVQGIASMTALKVDGSAVTQPVSDAGGSLTVDGTVAVSNLPATADTNSGAAGASTLRTVLATRHESTATPIAVRISNGTTATDMGAGAASSTTPRVVQAATNIAYQAKGKIAGTSLTGSYQTVLNPTSDLLVIYVINSCDNTILVSLDGGTTDTFELEAGESVTVDLAANNLKFDNTVNISAKHNGAAPTSGSVRVSGIG